MFKTLLTGLQPVLRFPFVRHTFILIVLLTVSTIAFAADPIRIEAEATQALITGTEPAAVASGHLASDENTTPLQVTVLGNPVTGDQAEVTIQGAAASTVWLTLTDVKGATLFQKKIEQTTETDYQVVPLGKNPGLYLLRVNTLNESATVKISKP